MGMAFFNARRVAAVAAPAPEPADVEEQPAEVEEAETGEETEPAEVEEQPRRGRPRKG